MNDKITIIMPHSRVTELTVLLREGVRRIQDQLNLTSPGIAQTRLIGVKREAEALIDDFHARASLAENTFSTTLIDPLIADQIGIGFCSANMRRASAGFPPIEGNQP